MMVASVTPIFDELSERLGLSWEDIIGSGADTAAQADERPAVEVLETQGA